MEGYPSAGRWAAEKASLLQWQMSLNNKVRNKLEVLQGLTNSCLGRRVAAVCERTLRASMFDDDTRRTSIREVSRPTSLSNIATKTGDLALHREDADFLRHSCSVTVIVVIIEDIQRASLSFSAR